MNGVYAGLDFAFVFLCRPLPVRGDLVSVVGGLVWCGAIGYMINRLIPHVPVMTDYWEGQGVLTGFFTLSHCSFDGKRGVKNGQSRRLTERVFEPEVLL